MSVTESIEWVAFAERTPTADHPMELECKFSDGSVKCYNWYIDEEGLIASGDVIAWREPKPKPYDTGMGTSPMMWQLVSEALEGMALPDSLNKAIYALCNDEAMVVRAIDDAMVERAYSHCGYDPLTREDVRQLLIAALKPRD